MSIKDEITKAIGAHGAWKQRLHTAIDTGKSDANVADTSRDNACPFGKWMYGATIDAKTKGSVEYKEVQKLHAEFHKAAAHVLEVALQGKKDEASKLMAAGSVFTGISGRLTAAMMHWQSHSGA